MSKIEITEERFWEMIYEGVKDFSKYVLPKLKAFNCSYNQLTSLPELPNVKWLNCSGNKLTSLPEMPNMKDLDCSDNQLSALPELPNVENLYCSGNKLTALPEMLNVRKLFCANNKLDHLPNYMTSPTSGRGVLYMNNKVYTGCFCGTIDEFYEKGYVQEGKEWVKEFTEKIRTL